ncbi:MAG: TIGR02206 family membrane protein [Candidatus Marinimicrobia bacterium]|nr:TIGR02206 family membrane protein [Candidatus Neomarinimicrobiota bacterium]MCF7829395.1 TIGR02206 family membrane protein [Candidatus Neomarinimicrobiota bacterium]MCF7880881.1 TIGR02206 family membrane protein [Candidatus Neomarinimicrobiota bacterium]
MWPYFATDYSGNPFIAFSYSHWIAIAVLLILYIGLFRLRNYFRDTKSADKFARYGIAGLLIFQEVMLSVWRLANNDWTVATALPLHLCGAAVVLSAIMLINRNYLLYEITFFWGLGGAIQALVTPDIGPYGFPHFRFFQFFVSHGTIIFASLYMTFVYRYRPAHSSVWKIFALTNVYAACIGVFNWLTGGNYLFICHKPETGSLLDVLGPWPWYILSLEVVALVLFYIYYSPFALRRIFAPRE